MIDRVHSLAILKRALSRSSAVVLLGPRQCGKTTLCRQLVSPESPNYFDLEDPVSLARLDEPLTALQSLEGLVVIDEIQRRPELFPVLRVLIDRNPVPGRFLMLGSASMDLLRQSSESLAGRLELVELAGLSIADLGRGNLEKHWQAGGFPLSFLATSDEDSFAWRKNFVTTFLERDLLQLGVRIPASALLRFWTMLAHYHGQIWNAAELANALQVNEKTTRRYLDLLEGLLMVRQLKPWHANVKKRQVKAPKVYFRDSGLLHLLLGIKTYKNLLEHPKIGASWEGYALEETLKMLAFDNCFFWATHNGAELDLLLLKDDLKFGVEFKRKDAPKITPSIKSALVDLDLQKLTIVYPGDKPYKLADQVQVMPLNFAAGSEINEITAV
jgi:uncharacterized protein